MRVNELHTHEISFNVIFFSIISIIWNSLHMIALGIHGTAVLTPVSTNLGLNFNLGFFFLLSKGVSRTIFSILSGASNHQIVGKKN